MGNSKKDILSNIAWLIFDKIFLLFLNLFVTLKVANYFTIKDYGDFQYAISVVAILEIIVNIMDGRVVKKKYLTNKPEQVVFNATICRILISILAAIIGFILIIFQYKSYEYCVVFTMLLLEAIVINLRFGMVNRFEYILKAKKIVLSTNIASLISVGLKLLAINNNCGIISLAAIAAITAFINLFLVTIQYKKYFQNESPTSINKYLIKEMVTESIPLAIAGACSIIYSRCDSVMLGNMLSTSEVAIYSIAIKINNVAHMAIIPIRESFFPKLLKLYTQNKELYAKQYIKITCILNYLFLFIAISSFIVLPYAFKYLKEDYQLAFPIYKIYILGSFFAYNAALRAGHLTMINRGDILMHTQLASVVLNIGLNYFFIINFGMRGAAIATVVTQMISLFFSNLFFRKVGKEIFYWQLKSLNPLRLYK